MRSILAVICTLGLWTGTSVAANDCPKHGLGDLAIIVDDLGYNLDRGSEIARLPDPVTLAIIPHTPHARELARIGQTVGKEIIVHMPMSSHGHPMTDPLALKVGHADYEMERIIDTALGAVPGAIGMNNHMGSRLTEDRSAMETTMRRLKDHGLFFIDSRTSGSSVAAQVAREMSLPTASRSVFLDNERSRRSIRRYLARAVYLARHEGSTIAIGHPYPETLQILREELPKLPGDIRIRPASEIVYCQSGPSPVQRLTSIP